MTPLRAFAAGVLLGTLVALCILDAYERRR